MRELRIGGSSDGLGLPAVARRTAHGCDLDTPSTGCYLSFPYFFPLSGVVGRPDGTNAVYAKQILGVDASRAAAGLALAPIAPPLVPPSQRLTLEHRATSRAPCRAAAAAACHRLAIRLTGPSHMALVLPEGRLQAWSLTDSLPPPRRSPFARAERVVFAFFTAGVGVMLLLLGPRRRKEEAAEGDDAEAEADDAEGEEPAPTTADDGGDVVDGEGAPETEDDAEVTPQEGEEGSS